MNERVGTGSCMLIWNIYVFTSAILAFKGRIGDSTTTKTLHD